MGAQDRRAGDWRDAHHRAVIVRDLHRGHCRGEFAFALHRGDRPQHRQGAWRTTRSGTGEPATRPGRRQGALEARRGSVWETATTIGDRHFLPGIGNAGRIGTLNIARRQQVAASCWRSAERRQDQWAISTRRTILYFDESRHPIINARSAARTQAVVHAARNGISTRSTAQRLVRRASNTL